MASLRAATVALLLLSSAASAKGPIQPWALMRYDTDKQAWVVQEIYETKAECEQWRQTQTGGVYACVKTVKKIPPPPDHVEIDCFMAATRGRYTAAYRPAPWSSFGPSV